MGDETKKRKFSLTELLAKNENIRKVIIGAGMLGIALIFLSGYLTSGGVSSQPASSSSRPSSTAADYEDRMEKQMTKLVSGIRGVGNAQVFITLEQTAQSVYATEEKQSGQTTQDKTEGSNTRNESNSDNETTYILEKNADGSERALAVTEIQPIVKGVVVVCDGGDNPQVQQNVTDAVTTALHITSVRVCVMKAK